MNDKLIVDQASLTKTRNTFVVFRTAVHQPLSKWTALAVSSHASGLRAVSPSDFGAMDCILLQGQV